MTSIEIKAELQRRLDAKASGPRTLGELAGAMGVAKSTLRNTLAQRETLTPAMEARVRAALGSHGDEA